MMKIKILFSFLALLIILSGCSDKKADILPEGENSAINSECLELCSHLWSICPSLISENQCERECDDWDKETREKARKAGDCAGMAEIGELLDSLIPEIGTPELEEPSSDCESACNKYVITCLTLVPNAGQDLFNDGYESCLEECAKWDAAKVECMIGAFDCPAMTEVCGL
jgi:hypothetical protein